MAELAAGASYPNPREITADGVAALLRDAWEGRRPASREPGAPDRRAADAHRPGGGELRRRPRSASAAVAHRPGPAAARLRGGQRPHRGRMAVRRSSSSPAPGSCPATPGRSSSCSPTRSASPAPSTSSPTPVRPRARPPPCSARSTSRARRRCRRSGHLRRGMAGIRLCTSVTVTDTDGAALPDAVVDVWQSNADGFYDVQLPRPRRPRAARPVPPDAEGRVRVLVDPAVGVSHPRGRPGRDRCWPRRAAPLPRAAPALHDQRSGPAAGWSPSCSSPAAPTWTPTRSSASRTN